MGKKDIRQTQELIAIAKEDKGMPDMTDNEFFTLENFPDFNSMVLVNEEQAYKQGLVRDTLNVYHSRIQPRLELILSMRRDDGMTIEDIAKAVGTTGDTLLKYAKIFEELRDVLIFGKAIALAKVKTSMYNMAVGKIYLIPRTKIMRSKNEDGETIYTPVPYDDPVFIAPNFVAAQAILAREDPTWIPKNTTVHEGGDDPIKILFEVVGQKAMTERDAEREVPNASYTVKEAKTLPPLPSAPDEKEH